MLVIKNLHARVESREILKGINLTVNAGEIHAVMGPNGSGKSTLAHILAGREGYEVTAGSVTYEGKDLLAMEPEEREIHAVMGPNGSGKSTLAHILAGREGYEVTAGSVTYEGKDLLAMEPEER